MGSCQARDDGFAQSRTRGAKQLLEAGEKGDGEGLLSSGTMLHPGSSSPFAAISSRDNVLVPVPCHPKAVGREGCEADAKC